MTAKEPSGIGIWRGTAAATVRLLCVSPQPPGKLPKQPDGPPCRPGLRPALSVAAVPGRHAVSRVPFVKYLCGACCVPGLVPPIHGPMSQLMRGMLLTGLLSLSAATLSPSQPTRSPVAPASLFSKLVLANWPPLKGKWLPQGLRASQLRFSTHLGGVPQAMEMMKLLPRDSLATLYPRVPWRNKTHETAETF